MNDEIDKLKPSALKKRSWARILYGSSNLHNAADSIKLEVISRDLGGTITTLPVVV